MFVELMPLLAGRTVLITVAKVDDKTLCVNVIPHGKADENPALVRTADSSGWLSAFCSWRLPLEAQSISLLTFLTTCEPHSSDEVRCCADAALLRKLVFAFDLRSQRTISSTLAPAGSFSL